MKPIYLHQWESKEDMVGDFEGVYDKDQIKELATMDKYRTIEVLLASYGAEGYEGYAFVLFRKDGKLFEVNGSHCSCYGLENQWDPEETSIKALERGIYEGDLGESSYNNARFKDELIEVLTNLKKEKES